MASRNGLTLLAVLVAGMGSAAAAYAGLGPIRVLSSEGEAFEAEIPVVDEDPQGATQVNLADRNHYPLLSTYSASAGSLKFTLLRKPDGSPQKVLVKGPAQFSEPLLRFAVEMSWPAGRLVREFEVDYLRDGPRKKDKAPAHDEQVKKAVVSPDQMPKLSSLGLGELKVKSRLGEPLQAELELFGAAPKQTDQVSVQLHPAGQAHASREQLQIIDSISHKLLVSPAGKRILQLQSGKPVNEPVLSFRLDVAAGNVRAQKQYTLLPDPTGYTVEERSVEQTASVPGRLQALKVYRVLKGDTLSSIASRMKGGGSQSEVVHHLYRSNPEAFVAGDVNKLKAGVALKYPAEWKVRPTQPREGAEPKLAEVQAKPAAAEKTPPAVKPVPPAKSAAKPPVEAAAAPPVTLKPMVKATPDVVSAKAVPASAPVVNAVKEMKPASAAPQTSRLQETLKQQDVALQAAQQKAKELEDKIRNLQQQASKPVSNYTPAPATETAAAAPSAKAAASTPAAKAVEKPAAESVKAAVPAPVAASAPETARVAAPVTPPAAASAPATAAVAVPASAPAPAAKPTPVKSIDNSAPAQESIVDDVLATLGDQNTLMYVGGGAVALGALLLAQRMRKRKQSSEPLLAGRQPQESHSMLTLGPLTTLMSGLKRGEGIDLGSVDLIAEAEVYLAYGRIDQALEILREGLTREPMRQDLRYKLLEVLAMQPDKESFIAEATTARGIFGKDSTLWMRVCDLGQMLAPEHPLFAVAAPKMEPAVDLQPVRIAVPATPPVAEPASAVVEAPAAVKAEPAALASNSEQVAQEMTAALRQLEQHKPEVGLDLAAELGALHPEPKPEPMLDMSFLEQGVKGPAPLPPVEKEGLSGLDAFASLGEAELESAVKAQTPEPMLSMDFLLDADEKSPLPSVKVPAPAEPLSPAAKPRSEAEDKLELAKLYMEMGDKETAEALMKEAGHAV
ncbi:hypothetical protein [uncultured Aquitalea sp.]|uniref:FimV/HubP-related protein n=1 Tax=uncultured Aquitalea sp. TaxID=540272 RepID=UPI0025D7F9B0|nr:hypothetical protein [uncultured Aquitalea sp.]